MTEKKLSGRGGPGRGGGRKPNNPNGVPAISKLRAAEVIKTGNAPLDIMLKNMHWWDQHADNLAENIQGLMAEIQNSFGADSDSPVDPATLKELMEKAVQMTKGFLAARQNAQSCAVDAAPYVHARFQSVVLKKEGDMKTIKIRASLPPVSGADKEARSYRDGYPDDLLKHQHPEPVSAEDK